MITSWYYALSMNRADVKELECFVAVAEHLHFSKAARQLHLSQPPLTRHVQSLEEKLGTRLFTRNTHAVSLTETGLLYLEDARAILRHLDRAAETIRRAAHGETGRLRLAFIGALLDEKLVRLIQRFREKHPTYQIDVADLSPSAQMEALQSGELDGGFIGARPVKKIKGVTFLTWNREPLVLALPEKHLLAKVSSLRWADLNGLSWVMVSRQAAPAFRRQFSELIEKHQISARIVQESDRVPAILTMVAVGSGLTIVPRGVEHLIRAGIVFRKLPPPQPILEHAFAYQSRAITDVMKNFLGLLQKI